MIFSSQTFSYRNNIIGFSFYYYPDLSSGGLEFNFEILFSTANFIAIPVPNDLPNNEIFLYLSFIYPIFIDSFFAYSIKNNFLFSTPFFRRALSISLKTNT